MLNLPKSEEVEIPKVSAGREAEPNPFEPVVKRLNEKRGTALSYTFPNKSDDDRKAIVKARNAAQRAGKLIGVSVRVNITEDEKAGTATLKVWVVDKITRKPAEKAGSAKSVKADAKASK